MARAHLRVIVLGLCLLGCGVTISACGSSSSTSAQSSSSSGKSSSTSASASTTSAVTSNTAASRRLGSLTRALLKARTKPAVTDAMCVTETSAQRARSPFGPTGPPVFSCRLRTAAGQTAYDIQLLANGCYVAERRRPGKAIYGCGAARS